MREARAFARATRDVAGTQARLLAAILKRNRATCFGAAHGFGALNQPRAYQQRVPLSRYEDYADAITRIGAGEQRVLTAEPVELLEPTSGTTGGEKLIPFTAGLRRQFQRAVAAWMFDLLAHRPALRRGRAYWSISPAVGPGRRTAGGIAIGFDDDAQYLGAASRWVLRRLLVAPPQLARVPEIEAFRYCTLWGLLGAADLALISVWSPTFLLALFSGLEAWQERLCADIATGMPDPPAPLPAALRARFARPGGDPRRAAALRAIFRGSQPGSAKLRQVWPHLALISCWGDAAAARYLPDLRAVFPAAEFQAKGLLATEGCVTIPLLDHPAPVLAVRSHFYEFEELEPAGRVRLAHELDRGGRYRVVLTTAGGLYRYQLRDEVEVCGFLNQAPLLRFLGKSDCICDLVGEKLAEPHVRAVLDRVFGSRRITPRFALLVPVDSCPPQYRLYLQGPDLADSALVPALAADLDGALGENPHYAYARRLGQLAPVEVALLDPHGPPGWEVYEARARARGQRAGGIKPMILDSWTGWPALLDPGRQRSKPTTEDTEITERNPG